MKQRLGILVLALISAGMLVLGVKITPLAQAQGGVAYSEFGSISVPTLAVAAYSDTAGVITDGTVVMVDTSATYPTRKRFAVLPWNGNSLTRPKILGIALGNIPTKASLSSGMVLITGYHANAKMAATGLTAGALIKTAIGVNGAVTTVADSVSGACGWFLSYASNSTAGNSRGKVIITRPMGFFFGSL